MLMNAPGRYREAYDRWTADPAGFWGEAAKEIDWYQPAKSVFDGGAATASARSVGASACSPP